MRVAAGLYRAVLTRDGSDGENSQRRVLKGNVVEAFRINKGPRAAITSFLVATATIEGSTGLGVVQRIVTGLLFAVEQPSPEAVVIGRSCGAALFSIGIVCWLTRREDGSIS